MNIMIERGWDKLPKDEQIKKLKEQRGFAGFGAVFAKEIHDKNQLSEVFKQCDDELKKLGIDDD